MILRFKTQAETQEIVLMLYNSQMLNDFRESGHVTIIFCLWETHNSFFSPSQKIRAVFLPVFSE